MQSSKEEDVVRLAEAAGLDTSQASRIPADLRAILLQRFVSKGADECLPQNGSDILEEEKMKGQNEPLGHESVANLSGDKLEEATTSQRLQEFEVDASDLSFGFSTATDALASEAAFMENIGLYLNPKQALPMGKNQTSRERNPSGLLETTDILMWCDQTSPVMPQLVESPLKTKPQHSLLSFLHKTKPNDETEEERQKDSEPETSGMKWRLWNPDQENQINTDELWNAMFPNDSDLIDGDTASDPTLMEIASQAISTEPSSSSMGKSLPLPEKTVEFYCKPCGRPLCSKDALFRHNLSELHFKRTAGNAEENLPDQRVRTQFNLKKEKPATKTKPSVFTDHRCSSCLANVPFGCFGKHLVSHFHHHRSIGHPLHHQLILDNIHDVVKQAPFQCHICRFYFNFEDQFIDHWKECHRSPEVKSDCGFWCSACRTISSSELVMLEHLTNPTHLEVVTMINRSVSISIKKVELVRCSECPKRFRLQFSYQRHLRDVHNLGLNEEPQSSSSRCSICNFITRDKDQLQEHRFLAHRPSKKCFSCLICRKAFSTKYAAYQHKSSVEHRRKISAKKSAHICQLCGQEQKNLLEHMMDQHPKDLSQCCVCGEAFVTPQKLGSHLRSRSCEKRKEFSIRKGLPCSFQDDGSSRQCPCDFVAKSNEVLQLHLAVAHSMSGPWQCPRCDNGRAFSSRTKLHRHLLSHESEAHRCQKCSSVFLTSLAAMTHECRSQAKPLFHCSQPNCDFRCNKGSSLKSHMLTHQQQKENRLKCPKCEDFTCSRTSELKRHLVRAHQVGGEWQKVKCPACPYTTFSRQHLDRHLRSMHPEAEDGEKKLSCRWCSFSTVSLDNLRKHILKTVKHPGRYVYECHLCPFKVNAQLSFKSHLRREHPRERYQDIIDSYFLKPSLLL